MNTKPTQIILALTISSLLSIPAYARGGGFGGGGRSFGGGGFGGGGHSFGGEHSFGGGGGGFGGRSSGESHDFGGGFNSAGGQHGGQGVENHGGQGFENHGGQGFENHGGQGFENHGEGYGNHGDMPISSHPTGFPDHLPTDGGFGGISGVKPKTPQNFNNTELHNQGQSTRNSFNNNDLNHTNVNNVNASHTTNINSVNASHYGGTYAHAGGTYAHAGGYGAYDHAGYGAYGHAGYGAYGHAGYGAYGYHPYGGYGAGYAHGYWNGANCWGGMNEAAMWTCMGMSSLSTFLGLGVMGAEIAGSNNNRSAAVATQPVSTTNITYSGDNVYMNGQPAGTSSQYYLQAQQLASQAYAQPSGYPPVAPNVVGASSAVVVPAEKWEPLGVFSLAEPGQTQTNTMLQLAINQQGTVRGNYLNQLTNERSQIYGSLDKNTQRISWTIGENNATVFDTSLPDLVKDDSQVLVHYGPTNTQAMALIRLPAPAGATDGSPATSPTPGTSFLIPSNDWSESKLLAGENPLSVCDTSVESARIA